jgi:hypothetical protein
MWNSNSKESLADYVHRGIIFVFRYISLNFFNPFLIFCRPIYYNNEDMTGKKNREEIYYYLFKFKWFFLQNLSVEYVFIKLLSWKREVINKDRFGVRINSRLKQVKWNFYTDALCLKNIKDILNVKSLLFFSGIKYIWKALRYWVFGLFLCFVASYYLMYIRLIPFNKIILEWTLIVMFLYWLMSGFVFFIKKYQYSKFTSVIQRFWKRTYILFWLIESGVFIIFFYLTLNASEEPVYMYDQMKIYKTHLFSWRCFLLKLLPISTLVVLGYYTQLSLKWNTFSKHSPILLLITLILTYVLWLEFYQFFHVINFFGNLVWVYDYDEYLWNLELEFRRTRLANNYVAVCLMAKFWHLVFIFVFWLFFMLRVNEIGRIRYPLLVANLQNFIILYLMSWLYMYPWLKFVIRPHMDVTYYWFFLNARHIGVRVFFNDIKLYYFTIFSKLENLESFFNFKFLGYKLGLFYYWIESSTQVGFDQYKKHIVRDYIVEVINKYDSNYALDLYTF